MPSNTLPANIAVQGLGRTQVAKPFLDGYAPATVPRVGQKAMQRQPGPGQYDVKGAQAALAESASVQTAAFGEQMQPAVDLRSLVNKSQASVPSSHDYEPKFVSLVNQPQIGSAFQSKSIRFGMTDTQKTQQAVPVDYSGEHGYEYGSVAHNVARAAHGRLLHVRLHPRALVVDPRVGRGEGGAAEARAARADGGGGAAGGVGGGVAAAARGGP